jgi:fatty aldehyde-generating acyl-ACP reductase
LERFGFIIHPIDIRKDVAKRFPALSRLPLQWLDLLSGYFPPVYLSHITGIRSALGTEAEGWLVACPLTPSAMKRFPLRRVYRQIIRAGRLAEKLGARIVGLGALTSAVGDAGESVARGLQVAVTTGNSYTVAVTCHAVRCIAPALGEPLGQLRVAVLGATGSIGSACSRALCGNVAHLTVIGHDPDAVAQLVGELTTAGGGLVSGSTDVAALRDAELIVSATNSAGPLIRPEHLRPGAAVYDLAMPPDVSAAVHALGVDAIVVSGGEVIVPGNVDFGFDFGLPPGHAYACMSETIALALEGRYENFTLGRRIAPERVKEIADVARRHGFRPAPLRNKGKGPEPPCEDAA